MLDIKYKLGKRHEAFLRWIVWHMPKRLVMWAFYRVVANATTGEYGNTIVPELTAMDAIQRWPVK